MRSISSRIEVTTALNSMPIEPSSRAGLTMTGKREVVREIEAAAERAREHRRVDAVELEDLLRDRLVLRVEQAVRSGAGEALAEQLEVGGDAVVRGVVAGERFGQVEDQIAIQLREGVQAFRRSVEDVEVGVVPELAERLGDFVLDFFLVERARQRRLVGGGARRLPAPPSDRRGRRLSVCPKCADYS